MDLPFAGHTLKSVYVEYTAMLEFGDCGLTLETEFSLETAHGSFRLDPDNFLDENFNHLSRLAGVAVTAASSDDETGDLEIEFANGARITTGPHADYEAWNVACGGTGGLKVVCLPSGGVMTWSPVAPEPVRRARTMRIRLRRRSRPVSLKPPDSGGRHTRA
jgi:hypothetical protein